MGSGLLSELSSITEVLADDESRARYAVDGVIPAAVTLPSTLEEAATCLRVAGEHGAVVAPRGGGTKGSLGNPLNQLDVVLSLERLDQVVEYVPEDLTITVQGGVPFARLQPMLAQHGQMLPIDPPRARSATVGGIVAANSTGPHRAAYGGVRDLVLGTRLALTDGRVVKTGGRVVKNVAGYDMNKLVVGSLGTLGVIGEVTLKLRPLPVLSRTLRWGFPTVDEALAAAESVLNSELLPDALAVLTPGVAARLDSPGPACLGVHLAESESNVVYQEERLLALLGAAGRSHALQGELETEFWEGVSNYGDRAGAALRARVNTVVSALGDQLRSEPGLFDSIAYVGSGTAMIYGLSQEPGSAANEALAAAVPAIFARAAASGGSAMLEAAPAEIRRSTDAWGPRRPEWKLSESIKRTLDPGGVLNRGRLAGGGRPC